MLYHPVMTPQATTIVNSLTLEKIMTSIDHTNAFLEQMHTDFKAEIADIKNQLKISTPEHLNEDKKLKMEEK